MVVGKKALFNSTSVLQWTIKRGWFVASEVEKRRVLGEAARTLRYPTSVYSDIASKWMKRQSTAHNRKEDIHFRLLFQFYVSYDNVYAFVNFVVKLN